MSCKNYEKKEKPTFLTSLRLNALFFLFLFFFPFLKPSYLDPSLNTQQGPPIPLYNNYEMKQKQNKEKKSGKTKKEKKEESNLRNNWCQVGN